MIFELPFDLIGNGTVRISAGRELKLNAFVDELGVMRATIENYKGKDIVAYRVDGQWRYRPHDSTRAAKRHWRKLVSKRAKQLEDIDDPIFQRSKGDYKIGGTK